MADQQEPSAGQRLVSAGLRGLRLGPAGVVAGMAGEGTRQANAALEHGAYKAGGAVTDTAAKVLPPEAAASLGYGTNVAIQAVPAVVGGAVTKAVTQPSMVAGAKRLMQSAIKPDFESLANGKAAKAIQTMLDEGISATEGGMAKLQKEVNTLREQVKTVIANSPAEIGRSKVANQLLGVLDRVQKQGIYKGDVKKVEAAWDEFMSHPLIKGDKIPVQLAQDMKKAGNRKLEADFGELGSADKESLKAIVRGLKEEIEKAVPAVGPINKRMGELLNVLKVAQRRSLVNANQQPGGIALLAENPAAGVAMALEKEAPLRSMAARLAYQNSGTLPTASGTAAGAAGGATLGTPPPEDRLGQIIDTLRR